MDLREWLPEGPEQPSNACTPNDPIVLDFGSAYTRIGVASGDSPAHSFASRSAKFRDRHTGNMHTMVGNDILLEPMARNQARTAFDGPLITNWDSAEAILDYSFDLVGYKSGKVAISEPLLAPHLPHRTLQELLFEGYDVSALAFGADVLAATCFAQETNCLVVYIGAETTHILPVVDGKPVIEHAKRINWGARSAVEFLHELLVLKYPTFPVPVTRGEVEQMLRSHCFAAVNYRSTVRDLASFDFLQQFERKVRAPLPVTQSPTSEEQKLQAEKLERRKESGRKLQEQAAAARVERLVRQQEELEQLQAFAAQLDAPVDVEAADAHAQEQGWASANEVRRAVRQLDNTLKRARGETIEDPKPVTPLLEVPDAELDPEQLKEKRRQRLLRASYDARQRQRAAKEERLRLEAEREAEDAAWRSRDLSGWSHAKRTQLLELISEIKARDKLRQDPRLRFRQTLSHAHAGQTVEEEEEVEEDTARDIESEAASLQALLLEHDPDFDPAQLEPKPDWKQSTVHRFLFGATPPRAPDGGPSIEQMYELSLGIERVRAIEPLFQPQMVGVDQAGLSESVVDTLRRFPTLASHIRLSGGGARVAGIATRLETDLRREMSEGVYIQVTVNEQPELDSWRGMAQWAKSDDGFVTRKEYDENGADFIKHHQWGNPFH